MLKDPSSGVKSGAEQSAVDRIGTEHGNGPVQVLLAGFPPLEHLAVVSNDAVKQAAEDMGYEDHITETGTEWADEVSTDNMADNEVSAGSSSWAAIVRAGAEHLAKTNPGNARDCGQVSANASDFVIPPNQSSNMTKRGSSSIRSQGTRSVHGGGLNLSEGLMNLSLALDGPEVQHKTTVEPIFLAYKCVSLEVGRLSLMQIATVVVQSLGDEGVVDAVQPMRSGWWIYLKTKADQERLVQSGITVAGKYIQLRSEFWSANVKSVKITLRDLPLHCVDNAEVLEAVSHLCTVLSPVQYGTLWHNG